MLSGFGQTVINNLYQVSVTGMGLYGDHKRAVACKLYAITARNTYVTGVQQIARFDVAQALLSLVTPVTSRVQQWGAIGDKMSRTFKDYKLNPEQIDFEYIDALSNTYQVV